MVGGARCSRCITSGCAPSSSGSAAARSLRPETGSWRRSTALHDAVRCGHAIAEAVRDLGIEIRAGVHTGEIELDGDDVRGIAVHIGARVGALAGASEVWASSTVRDLTAGSGLTFEDAGEHELRGVPDRWRLYRVVA